MEKAANQPLNVEDIASLYNQHIGEWLLLEILKRNNETGKLEKFNLITHNKDKDVLYKLMESEDWNWDKKYLFVFADLKSLCEV